LRETKLESYLQVLLLGVFTIELEVEIALDVKNSYSPTTQDASTTFPLKG